MCEANVNSEESQAQVVQEGHGSDLEQPITNAGSAAVLRVMGQVDLERFLAVTQDVKVGSYELRIVPRHRARKSAAAEG